MPSLADYLLANTSGGNFGTMSPGEEAAAVTPGSVLDALATKAYQLGAAPRDITTAGTVVPGDRGMVTDEDIARAQLSSGDVLNRAHELGLIMLGAGGGGGSASAGSGMGRDFIEAMDAAKARQMQLRNRGAGGLGGGGETRTVKRAPLEAKGSFGRLADETFAGWQGDKARALEEFRNAAGTNPNRDVVLAAPGENPEDWGSFSLGSGSRKAAPVAAPAIIRPEPLIAADEGLPATGARIGQPYNYTPGPRQTVTDPLRMAYPGIYKDPRQIALEAKAMVAPEDPALKELFGVTREDLYGMSQQGRRAGTAEPVLGGAAKPKGSYVANALMNERNAQRLIDANAEAERLAPELTRPMDAWYVMDPAHERLAQITENPNERYSRFNTMTSMASPGSDVETEINRGTAAHMMAERGRFEDFRRFGGMAESSRGADFPAELIDVKGHPYHSTSQALPMGNYLESGRVEMTSPKVPLYVQASEVPATGNQTRLPIPDAHFTRAIGAADVRKGAQPGVSMQMHEYQGGVGPWFRENVAGPLGIEAVPGQARTWGVFAPQTGVDTAIGAPKLELLAGRIKRRAAELGIPAELLRDAVLKGGAHAGIVGTAGAAGLGEMLLNASRQQQQQ